MVGPRVYTAAVADLVTSMIELKLEGLSVKCVFTGCEVEGIMNLSYNVGISIQ